MSKSFSPEIITIYGAPPQGLAPAEPLPLTVRCLRWLEMRSPKGTWVVGTGLIFGIGILSYISGPQLSCSLFYLIPILLITWVAGFRAGLFSALLAAVIWLIADLAVGFIYGHPVTPYWNATMRFGTFVVAASLVSAMRSLNDHLEERVLDRTAALEAQIEEKRELEKNILEISDRERAVIGQDLHDGLCQQLVSAAFSTNLLHEKLSKQQSSGTEDTARIGDMIDEAITQARNLARGLYPVRLETDGLEMALRELAATTSSRFNLNCILEYQDSMPTCGETIGIHLYRIAQEAVVNAAKHSKSTQIILSLSKTESKVRLVIGDNGVGIETVPSNPDGMGLRIMEYRARMIGAKFDRNSLAGQGTRITCELDVRALVANQ